MTNTVKLVLNIDDGPDVELSIDVARDLWEQLDKMFGSDKIYPAPYTPIYDPLKPIGSPYCIGTSDTKINLRSKIETGLE